MKLGRLDLAAFCVRHAAALKTDLRGSAMQQAIVQMFLNNHDKVHVLPPAEQYRQNSLEFVVRVTGRFAVLFECALFLVIICGCYLWLLFPVVLSLVIFSCCFWFIFMVVISGCYL